MNNFHRSFQNFRQFSNLFSQFRLKKRHTSLFSGICREIWTNFHQTLAGKMQHSTQKMKKIGNSFFNREKMLTIFCWNFEIWAVQKYVNLVDLVKSFPTSIYLQKSASIQPRTSLSKFGGKFNAFFIRLLNYKVCFFKLTPENDSGSAGKFFNVLRNWYSKWVFFFPRVFLRFHRDTSSSFSKKKMVAGTWIVAVPSVGSTWCPRTTTLLIRSCASARPKLNWKLKKTCFEN